MKVYCFSLITANANELYSRIYICNTLNIFLLLTLDTLVGQYFYLCELWITLRMVGMVRDGKRQERLSEMAEHSQESAEMGPNALVIWIF